MSNAVPYSLPDLRMWLVRLTYMGRANKRRAALVFDIGCCILASLMGLSLRLGYWQTFTMPVLLLTLLALACWFPLSFYMGIYTQIVRFNGLNAMYRIAQVCAATIILLTVALLLLRIPGIPRTMGVLQPLIFLILLTGGRMAVRTLLIDAAGRLTNGSRQNAIIYGAGGHGRQLAASLQLEGTLRLVGFLDDEIGLDRHQIFGHRVYHTANIARTINDLEVNVVLLAMPNASRSRRREIFDQVSLLGVQVRTLPELKALVDGSVSFSDLRPIRIEDLLQRDTRPPDEKLLGQTITGKVILVSGAGGSIGSELCRQIIACSPKQLILCDSSEYALFSIDRELTAIIEQQSYDIELMSQLGSVNDARKVERMFAHYKPDTVYHAAAYKHVPLVEANPLSGIANNIFGTLFMAEAAAQYGTKRFILISTDKAVRPTNVMGATKRICELILQALAHSQIVQNGQDDPSSTIFSMVRFGNVLGSSGSVVPSFQQQIIAGGPVTVTHKDVTRFFMTVPEAAQLVMQAGAMASGGDVFILDMGEPVKIYDLALTMIRLAGRSVRHAENEQGDIEIRVTGLRPGEKLYEELLIGSHPKSTGHPRISKSQEHFILESELREHLARLNGFVDEGGRSGAIEVVKELVPEYVPAAL